MCGTALCVFCVSGCTCHDCVCVRACVAFALCVGVVRMFVVLCDGVCVHYTCICTCTVLGSECLMCVCTCTLCMGIISICSCVGSDACFEAAPAVPPTVPENPTSPLTPPMPRPPGACAGEEVNPDLVSVYADRMCAVMHAFATVCTTLQRASGR